MLSALCNLCHPIKVYFLNSKSSEVPLKGKAQGLPYYDIDTFNILATTLPNPQHPPLQTHQIFLHVSSSKFVVLNQGQFCPPAPTAPEDIWQCLETFLVVPTLNRSVNTSSV